MEIAIAIGGMFVLVGILTAILWGYFFGALDFLEFLSKYFSKERDEN